MKREPKPRCEVDGCKRVAAYAISTTLSWTRNANLTTEVNVCAVHTKAHEKARGRALPAGDNHG